MQAEVISLIGLEAILLKLEVRVDYRLQLYSTSGSSYHINLICNGVDARQKERTVFHLIASTGEGHYYRYQSQSFTFTRTRNVWRIGLSQTLLASRFNLTKNSALTLRCVILRNGFIGNRIFELFPLMRQPSVTELEIVWPVPNILVASRSHFEDQFRSEFVRVQGPSRIDYRLQMYESEGYYINLTCNGVDADQPERISFQLITSDENGAEYSYEIREFEFTHTKTVCHMLLDRKLLVSRFNLNENFALTFRCTVFLELSEAEDSE